MSERMHIIGYRWTTSGVVHLIDPRELEVVYQTPPPPMSSWKDETLADLAASARRIVAAIDDCGCADDPHQNALHDLAIDLDEVMEALDGEDGAERAAWLEVLEDLRAHDQVLVAVDRRIRELNPPPDADLPTWHALHQVVLLILSEVADLGVRPSDCEACGCGVDGDGKCPCGCAEPPKCPSLCGEHHWLDRPESDTRQCLICGEERSG